jgi:hypothetical protein
MSPGWTNGFWLQRVDLNHRPLGYECNLKCNFNELAGVVAYFREWKIVVKSIEELLFWVGFGLASLVSNASPAPSNRISSQNAVIATTRRSAAFSE